MSVGLFLSCVSLLPFSLAPLTAQTAPSLSGTRKADYVLTSGDLPLSFERRGASQYFARGPGFAVDIRGTRTDISSSASGRIRIEFVGAQETVATPEKELPGKINYILGADPSQWRLGLPTYERVVFRKLYRGIDLAYYGNQKQLEFDLVLQPGADVRSIRMRFAGGVTPKVEESGDLMFGDFRLGAPKVLQAGSAIPARFRVLRRDEVGFEVGKYDHGRQLVIDPTLIYSTRFGGGNGYNIGYAVALDHVGNAYVAGVTASSDFPLVNAAYGGYQANTDGFVAKVNPTGTAFIYTTYLGGSNSDTLRGIAVDSTGAAWVAGYTTSNDFPLLRSYQGSNRGGQDAVVAKLDPNGSLAYSTFLGGPSTDGANAVAIDPFDNVYVTGQANTGFPTTAGVYQPTSPGSTDAFVAKFNSAGALLWATLVGGNSYEVANAIAVDRFGSSYITGITYSSSFPGAPVGGAQPTPKGIPDAFIAKLNFNASALLYFTFLGGSNFDQGNAISVDPVSGVAAVAGQTFSLDLPTTPGAVQHVNRGTYDGFVVKLNASGSAFLYVTYLGGTRNDFLNAIALDPGGNAYVAGYTHSNDFPTSAPLQTGIPGNSTSLFRTANTGASWAPFDTTLPGVVSSILADPASSSTILASTEGGIYRTIDNGATWSQRFTAGLNMDRSSTNPAVVYGMSGTSVYQSVDDGLTWAFKGAISVCCGSGIVADPLNSSIAYVYGSASIGVLKTINNGATWTSAATGIPANQNIAKMVATPNGDLYVALRSSVGGKPSLGVYRSSDHGGTWVAASGGLAADFPLGNMAAATSSSSVYLTDFFTVYRTTNGGASWTIRGSLPVTPGCIPSSLAVSPVNDSILYFAPCYTGYSTASLWVSTDSGSTWSPGNGLGVATISLAPVSIVADPLTPTGALAVASVSNVAVVAKLDSNGQNLISSAYWGDQSLAYGIAANGSGEAFVTGQTNSLMPLTPGVLQGNRENVTDVFLARISDAASTCTYSVDPAQIILAPWLEFARYVVTAPSGCTWAAASDQPWAFVASGSSGSGSGIVYVRMTGTTSTTRNATLTIAGRPVSLRQLGGSCGNAVSPDSVAVPAGGGASGFALRVASGCDWTVVTDDSGAVTITSATSGTGNASVTFNVAPNLGANTRTMYVYSPQGGRMTISQAGQVAPAVVATITSTPAGASITAIGSGCIPGTYTTPANLTWAANTNCTVNFTTPQTIGGTQYVFQSATVNGGPTTTTNPLTVNAGSSALTIAANFMNPCTYSLVPAGQAFGSAGGIGSFAVNTAAGCGWSAVSGAGWITILPSGSQGPGKVNFAVSANTGVARSAAITVAGQHFNIDQAALSCAYTIGPTSAVWDSNGGDSRVVVTASTGCAWKAVSNAGWLTVTSGASGSGNGAATVHTAANSGAARSGTVTIAGQAFSVSQGAPGATFCGATDVTSKVVVTDTSHSLWSPPYLYSGNIIVRNNSSSVIRGPVYVVLVGEPTHFGYPNDSLLLGTQPLTTCVTPLGDYLLPISGDLAPGASAGYATAWLTQSYFGRISYSLKVISGTPSH